MQAGPVRPRIFGVIPAFGNASRQGALCNARLNPRALPKILLPVANLRLGDFSVHSLQAVGCERIYIGGGAPETAATIDRYFGNSSAFNFPVATIGAGDRMSAIQAVKYLMAEHIKPRRDDLIIVANCDGAHNLDLNPLVNAHLAAGAAASVAILPLEWSSEKWTRSTVTMEMEGLPKPEDYSDRHLYSIALDAQIKEQAYSARQINSCHEYDSPAALHSNLIRMSIYVLNAGFLEDLFSAIDDTVQSPAKFSDFGFHLTPLLAGRTEPFKGAISTVMLKRIKAGKYPFFGVLYPTGTYWRNVNNPSLLLDVNLDVMARRLSTRLDSCFWHQEPWGWRGKWNSAVHYEAMRSTTLLGSLVGSHSSVDPSAQVENSFILDYNHVSGSVTGTVCFPGTEKSLGVIPSGTRLVECLYCGGDLRPYSNLTLTRQIIAPVFSPPAHHGISFFPLGG